MAPDTEDDSGYYGIWASVGGFVFGFAIVVVMFTVATGFR